MEQLVLLEGGHNFEEKFKDLQLPFPGVFQQRFTMSENVYSFT